MKILFLKLTWSTGTTFEQEKRHSKSNTSKKRMTPLAELVSKKLISSKKVY